MLSRMYLWELIGHDTAEGVIVSGIDGDLAAAMRAGAGLLTQPRGFVVRIAEVVPRMSVLHLDEIYVPTGRCWLGRRTRTAGVHWDHTFHSVDPGAVYGKAASQDVRAVAS
jgi:hypothetical protein